MLRFSRSPRLSRDGTGHRYELARTGLPGRLAVISPAGPQIHSFGTDCLMFGIQAREMRATVAGHTIQAIAILQRVLLRSRRRFV
jgi:hypothetical protein